jgi:hypothetical protein
VNDDEDDDDDDDGMVVVLQLVPLWVLSLIIWYRSCYVLYWLQEKYRAPNIEELHAGSCHHSSFVFIPCPLLD